MFNPVKISDAFITESRLDLLSGVLLLKLSPGAEFFDSDVRPVTRDCFLPLYGSDHLSYPES